MDAFAGYIQGSAVRSTLHRLRYSMGGGFQFSFAVETNRSFRVQTSTNLLQWQDFTNYVPGGTNVDLTDPTTSTFKRRYYRVISP